MSLKERIAEMFGAEADMTALAKKIGVSRPMLYAAYKREEHGKPHNIDIATAIEIRKLSGRSLSWILTGEEDAPRAPDVELRAARRVAREISRDLSIPIAEARAFVGRFALDDGVNWADDLELYRIVRSAAGVPNVKAHSSAPMPTKLLGVGQEVPARRKR